MPLIFPDTLNSTEVPSAKLPFSEKPLPIEFSSKGMSGFIFKSPFIPCITTGWEVKTRITPSPFSKSAVTSEISSLSRGGTARANEMSSGLVRSEPLHCMPLPITTDISPSGVDWPDTGMASSASFAFLLPARSYIRVLPLLLSVTKLRILPGSTS